MPFLLPLYRSHRAVFFRLVSVLPLHSSTTDRTLIDAIEFIKAHRGQRKTWLPLLETADPSSLLELSWIPKKWWPLVSGQKTRSPSPDQVHRVYFELCVFSHLLLELQSGDVYLQGSDEYGDYYGQLLSWDDYQAAIEEYGQLVNLPTDPKAFTRR